MSIRERIWYELIDSKYRVEYLCFYVDEIVKKNKMIDNTLILISLGSIGGWYKFSEYYLFWSVLLLLLTGFRIMKSKFLITEQEIGALKSVYEFYVDHVRKIESLWLRYDEDEIGDEETKIQFEKFQDEERLMSKINKINKIHEKGSISKKARANTDQYLKRISI